MAHVSGCEQVRRDAPHGIGRNRKADPDASAVGRRGKNCCIDSDDLTLAVHQRSPRVTGIDGSIGLNDVVDDSAIFRLNGSSK